MSLTRRTVLGISIASFWSMLKGSAFAQATLTPEQKKGFASIYAAKRPAAADMTELGEILRLQENLKKFPVDPQNIKAFVARQPLMQALSRGVLPVLGQLYVWHEESLRATALDHTTYQGLPKDTYGDQLGPARSSRALAIVHLAMFEAVNAITRTAQSYQGIQAKLFAAIGLMPNDVTADSASVDMAICQAAYLSLSALYAKQKDLFKAKFDFLYVKIPDGPAKAIGQRIGAEAANQILQLRIGADPLKPLDHADPGEPPPPAYDPSKPLSWAPDPIAPGSPPVALGTNWYKVTPFVMSSAAQFRPTYVPPSPADPTFAQGYQEIGAIGGDPDVHLPPPRWSTSTQRHGTLADALDESNETFKAIFWAYDGTPSICAPPRLYNMIATSIALNERPIVKVDEFARFLALVNIALADAGIGAWEAKYHFAYARPVTVLRHIDAAGNQNKGDAHWTPLGAQVTNGTAAARNLTPPFPAYPSGHAVFGAALFQTLRRYWSLPEEGIPFHFVSDEFNGQNEGPGENVPRPYVNRPFASFTAAEYENAQSRLWMGIHWPWDRDQGIAQGRNIGNHVYDHVLQVI